MGLQREYRQERERDDQKREKQRRADLDSRVHQRTLAQLLIHTPMLVFGMLKLLVGILDHHHGRIDHGTDCQRDAAQRQDVCSDPLVIHDDERREDPERKCQDGDQCRSQVKQEDDADDRDNDELFYELG